MTKIMILTLVKNSGKYLDRYWNSIKKLDYPKEDLRIVFMYGESADNTLEKLRAFSKENVVGISVYREGHNPGYRIGGQKLGGEMYEESKGLLKDTEDYVLLLDSDIADVPSSLINDLIKADSDIASPYVWVEGHAYFYPTWDFRIAENQRFDAVAPPGMGLTFPIELDSVSVCVLIKRETYLNIPFGNPYPVVQFCLNAKAMGYSVVAIPNLEIFHTDLKSLGIIHTPFDPQSGGYPRTGNFVTSTNFYPSKYVKKTPEQLKEFYSTNLQKLMERIESEAQKRFDSDPRSKAKGLLWTKKFITQGTFFCTKDPMVKTLMYKTDWYPQMIEIELSTYCPFKCKFCEHTYWNEPPRNMTWDEFLLIVNNFDLCQCSYSGIGESWSNPIFMDCIKYIKDRGVFFEQYDNFQSITKERADQLVKWGVERWIISLDAATKETYENLRVGQKWDRVWDSYHNFQMSKKEQKSEDPVIPIHFIINKANYKEALKVIELARQEDVPYILFNTLLRPLKEQDLYMKIPKDLIQEIQAKAIQEHVQVIINSPVYDKQPEMNMCTAIFQPFFFVNGDVNTCCAQNDGNRREWQKEMSMGNIFEVKDFKKIWYGPRYTQLRRALLNNRCISSCYDCCIHNWKNKCIEEIVPK